jgi:RNA polymerase sigma-70 factor (ECF subfamily)
MAPEFPATQWSQLLTLGDPAHPRYREHLEGLCRRYWKPVYHYARAIRDLSAEDAEDLVQQFFGMLLERVDFASLSPERGSFRGFLKTALRRFVVSDERKRAVRAPRGDARLFRFEEAEAEWRDRPGGAEPEEAFDRAWARELLHQALARLKGECSPLQYALFRDFCVEAADAALSYAELARRHGVGEDDVRNRLREVRQRGREVLKEMLRDYLLPGEDVEAELRFILSK